MKAIIFYSVSALLFLVLMQSCKKNMDHTSKQVVIDTALSSGIEYQLNLRAYGDEDDVAAIIKQAANFTTSDITNASASFAPVYHYASLANAKFAVTDQVILAVTEGNRGNHSHHCDSTIITINFAVK